VARRQRAAAPRPDTAAAPDAPARAGGLTRRPTTDPDGDVVSLLHDDRESPLAWLHRRRDRDGALLIDARAFEAGERLRADFTRARLDGLTSNWRAERVSGGGGPTSLGDSALAARTRLTAALAATGPDLAGVLLDVCCYLKGLEQVEIERRWPARSAKVVLRIALDRLAAHYGPPPEARGPARAPARHWRSSDTPVPPAET
jgi:hypothetical protein